MATVLGLLALVGKPAFSFNLLLSWLLSPTSLLLYPLCVPTTDPSLSISRSKELLALSVSMVGEVEDSGRATSFLDAPTVGKGRRKFVTSSSSSTSLSSSLSSSPRLWLSAVIGVPSIMGVGDFSSILSINRTPLASLELLADRAELVRNTAARDERGGCWRFR